MRRLPLLVAPLVVASLALTACGGGESSAPKASATPSATPTPAPEPIVSPLTGEVLATLPANPVMVTKMDNTPASAPQVGLSKADMVVEELVEGGVTRLATFFWTTPPKLAGPVRSMRASDIGIVTPARARIITSGGAPETIARIKGAGITYFEEGAAGIFRDTSRRAPYNLFSDPAAIAAKAAPAKLEMVPYFTFGEAAQNPAGQPATSLSAAFGSRTSHWTFANGRYTNTNTLAGEGDTFEPTSVVALEVELTDAGYRDPAGNFVPESHLIGQGNAWIFHNGRVVRGTWHKAKADSTISITQGAKKLVVPTGKTFVELVPRNQGGVTFAP